MKERPILFSAPMVRALLDGSKTQTRRVLKLPHGLWETSASGQLVPIPAGCPYGAPGARLWVRETWQHFQNQNGELAELLEPKNSHDCFYRADESDPSSKPMSGNWRPSIFMPRWASRITLEVTAIRVERLKDISEGDARAEGARECDLLSGREVLFAGHSQRGSYVLHYRDIWETINGAGSWAANPWVWVVEFKRLP